MDGIFAALSFLAVIILIYTIIRVSRKNGAVSAKGEYDERQMVIRGRGYKLGCILYMIEFAFLMFSDGCGIDLPLTNGAQYSIMFFLPIGAFSVYCIMKDAYIGIRNDIRRFIILSAIIVIVDIVSTVAQIAGGAMIAEGKLTNACITPACGLLFLVVLLSLLIRNSQIKAEERSGNEES